MSVDRREFIKAATTGAGVAAITSKSAARRSTPGRGQGQEVVVIGGGTFGMWTALNLRREGASVTVVDAYGPGNSRSTSGAETRGVRSSYGDRRHGLLWTRWAREAIDRWTEWDADHQEQLLPELFFKTGDLIMRNRVAPYIEDTRAHWDELGTPYEVLDADEVAYRWPWIRFEDLEIALYEPDAGVVRSRRAIESVHKVFKAEGGSVRIDRAAIGGANGRTLHDVTLGNGDRLSGAQYIFACGPWFPKLFPQLMGKKLRIPIGHVFYFATSDRRFMFPNMPSYGVPGCTGWPALGPDHRGFRVRTGGRSGNNDPDTSDRWIDTEFHERPRQILERHFPDLVGAPINETRACHYEFTTDRNFIVDRHPDYDNVWIAGGGTAEAFKFGPVLGEYIARRVLGIQDDPELAEQFKLKDREFDPEG